LARWRRDSVRAAMARWSEADSGPTQARLAGNKLAIMRRMESVIHSKGIKFQNIPTVTMLLDQSLASFETAKDIREAVAFDKIAKPLVQQNPTLQPVIDACATMRNNLIADYEADPNNGGVFSKEAADAINKSSKEFIDEIEYAFGPVYRMLDDIQQKQEYAIEKMHYLHELKLSTILEEHPEWGEEIRRKLYNLEFEPPSGMPFDE